MASITIEVTQRDIEAGVRFDCYRCPVAIALHRAIGRGDVGVWKNELFVLIDCGETHFALPLPDEAEYWVSRFDRQLPVKPIAIEVEWPPRPANPEDA